MVEHSLKWTAPSPLWVGLANTTDAAIRRKFNQPAILRFATDAFMENFIKILESDPAQIADLVVQRETWREPLLSKKTEALLEPAPPLSKFARRLQRARLATDRLRNGSASSFSIDTTTAQKPLKLYQPAHERYYLVTAHLVCAVTGLPDHAINVGNQERVSFVMRRLLPATKVDRKQNLPAPDSSWEEYAMVTAPTASGWQKVARTDNPVAATLWPGEETLPLFAVSFTEDDGRRRKLLAGLVPTGKREAYMGASLRAAAQPGGQSSTDEESVDPRMLLFWSQVTEPWKRLAETAFAARQRLTTVATPAPSDLEKKSLMKVTREQAQVSSWYVLLDLAKLLKEQIPNVWQSLMGQPVTVPLQTPQLNLLNALAQTIIGGSEAEAGNYANRLVADRLTAPFTRNAVYTADKVVHSLKDALIQISGGLPYTAQKETAMETKLDAVTAAFNREDSNAPTVWLPFLFPLADLQPNNLGPQPPKNPDKTEVAASLQAALDRIDYFAKLIEQALPKLAAAALAPLPLAAQAPADIREGWFVIRCVFERPACGVLEPPVVSAATRPFQIAGFFDPDAPARPIRIALPIDTSPAGLRKFDKNTAFMISDILCGQIDRMKGLSLGDLVLSVLPWPFHKDLSVPEKGPCTTTKDPSLQAGMICSLSIPIITICALLLLMIIVSLLDIIFRWIPYFLICFPLPGFKAKK